MGECWRCGRAVPEYGAAPFIFGTVCDRQECEQVVQAISKRFRWFWFKRSLSADDGDRGRTSAFSRDGDYRYPRGYDEPSLQTRIDADRMIEERRTTRGEGDA